MIKNPGTLSKKEREYRKNIGGIFNLAPYIGIWFDDNEIRYIKTKMETDKLYRAISGAIAGKCDVVSLEARIIWLQKFFKKTDLPLGIKAFIYYYIGTYQADIKTVDECNENHEYINYVAHSFLTEKWMEICH